MPTCDLNKVALQRYRNHALTLSEHALLKTPLGG